MQIIYHGIEQLDYLTFTEHSNPCQIILFFLPLPVAISISYQISATSCLARLFLATPPLSERLMKVQRDIIQR